MSKKTKDFIRLEDVPYGEHFIVNINNITFYEGPLVVAVSGVLGEGDSLMTITKESAERLTKMLEERLWDQ